MDDISNTEKLENSSTRQTSQDDINRRHEEQIIKHKELMERRKQNGFYRSSITSQLKQHQIKPTEFGKFWREDEFSINSYHSPTIDNNGSMQYWRRAKIFDKFVHVMNNKTDAGINFLENSPSKLPYIYKQNSSNLPLKRERNLNSLMSKEVPVGVNKSSQDSRRATKVNMVSDSRVKQTKKEPLHIHKSFSFKCTSKRDMNSGIKNKDYLPSNYTKNPYKYMKFRDSQNVNSGKDVLVTSFFQI